MIDNGEGETSELCSDARYARIETRLGDVESRLDRVEASLDRVETRLNRVETKLDNIDVSLIKLSGELTEMKEIVEAYDVKLDAYHQSSEQVLRLSFGLSLAAILSIVVSTILGG